MDRQQGRQIQLTSRLKVKAPCLESSQCKVARLFRRASETSTGTKGQSTADP